MQPLISVIVPVYKVEAYLDRCVESIVSQTYRNLEIILVDDGSPDRSGAICDQWAEKDPRIKVIHKENGGGGSARNAALDVAQGEFIGMIDSDDYIEAHMYEHLYGLIDAEIDIAECCMVTTDSDDCLLDDGSDFQAEVYDVQDAMRLHITNKLFLQTPPNKLYRRSTVQNVYFPSGTGIDDEFWTYRAIANARKLAHSSCRMYAYRQQSASVMHNLSAPQRLRAVEAKVQRHAYIETNFPDLKHVSLKNLWFTCIYQGQVALRQEDQTAAKQTITYLADVLSAHPCKMKGCTAKETVWLMLARLSIGLTCKIRNRMKIGF